MESQSNFLDQFGGRNKLELLRSPNLAELHT